MLVARQVGATHLDTAFHSETRRHVGGLRWPDRAVATQSRLKHVVPAALSQTLDAVCDGVSYRIDHTHDARGYGGNRVRCRLTREPDVLATAQVAQPRGLFRRPVIRLESPVGGGLANAGHVGVHHARRCGNDAQGHVRTRGGPRLTREHVMALPDTLGGASSGVPACAHCGARVPSAGRARTRPGTSALSFNTAGGLT